MEAFRHTHQKIRDRRRGALEMKSMAGTFTEMKSRTKSFDGDEPINDSPETFPFPSEKDADTFHQQKENLLISQAAQGGETAFRLLYLQYRHLVAAAAFRVLYNRHEAEEIVQETFVRAYRSLKTFRAGENSCFSAWLKRIAINAALKQLKKRQRRKLIEIPYPESSDNIPDANSNQPRRQSEFLEFEQAFRETLGSMASKYSEPFTLAVMENLSYDEVAELLGISKDTVKVRIFRARKQLQMRLHAFLPS